MNKWSDKYIGRKYKFGSSNLEEGTDCLRLIEEIYKREKNYTVKEDGKPVTSDWYTQNPDRLIRQAVEHGKTIKDIKELREFDAVFFKMKNVIRHIGVMIDNYGHFVHQLEKRTSRVDDVHGKYWNKRFFCGIRPNFNG